MIQMYQRGKGRLSRRGCGRTSQTNLEYAQYQQFLEFQKMSQLSISEGSEVGSSDLDPPQKITQTDDDPENPWKTITGKTSVNPTQKRRFVPNIIDDIEQTLYPPGYTQEEYSPTNIVGKIFLRNCRFKE